MSNAAPTDSILPVFFGQDSDLYGCFHLTADYAHAPALLICQPIGHEYERCHRAMRQLAVQAARKGFSTLRFDYHSTGDSAGACDELSLSQMRLDIEQAIKCCCDKTGVARLTVVGLRMGATLAAQLAGTRSEIDSLVLYAPVFDGETLLAEWQRDHQSFVEKHSHSLQHIGAWEVLGFPVAEKFQQELRSKFYPEISGSSLKRVFALIDEAEQDSSSLKEWVDTFERQGIAVTVEAVENIALWRREAMEAIVPIKTIRRIVKWIGGD